MVSSASKNPYEHHSGSLVLFGFDQPTITFMMTMWEHGNMAWYGYDIYRKIRATFACCLCPMGAQGFGSQSMGHDVDMGYEHEYVHGCVPMLVRTYAPWARKSACRKYTINSLTFDLRRVIYNHCKS